LLGFDANSFAASSANSSEKGADSDAGADNEETGMEYMPLSELQRLRSQPSVAGRVLPGVVLPPTSTTSDDVEGSDTNEADLDGNGWKSLDSVCVAPADPDGIGGLFKGFVSFGEELKLQQEQKEKVRQQ
jgi:hypothetical protein